MNDFVSVLIALSIAASVNLFPESRMPALAETAPCSCPVAYMVKPILPTVYNQWRFVGFADSRMDTIQHPVCRDTITLDITNGSYKGIGNSYFNYGFNGSSGVNQFWGSYRIVDHETIEFSPVLTSGKANPDCRMAFEKKYLAAISGKELKYQLRNNLLEFELDESRKMRFVLME